MIVGLTCNTTYHFRAVGTSTGGQTVGNDATFTACSTPTGDFDSDNRADLALYRPSTGQWYILQSSTNYTTYITPLWGLSTDIPVPGDYDGDRTTDLALYRPSTGQWYSPESATKVTRATGGTEYRLPPVPGDYDGDGKTDLGVYRPSTGQWYVLKSSGGAVITSWGLSIRRPSAG